MKRIIVIGSGGAGKSTFSKRLGRALNIEVIHLDAHFWKPNWGETPRDEWRRAVEEPVKGDAWAAVKSDILDFKPYLIYIFLILISCDPKRAGKLEVRVCRCKYVWAR